MIVSAGGGGGGGDAHLPYQPCAAPAGDLAMRGTSERPAAEGQNQRLETKLAVDRITNSYETQIQPPGEIQRRTLPCLSQTGESSI